MSWLKSTWFKITIISIIGFFAWMAFDTWYSPKTAAYHQVQPRSTVAQNIDNTLKSQHFNGTAYIVQNNVVILHKGYGHSVNDAKRKNTIDSKYNIASIQKNMTGMMVVKLIAAGKLSYDTPLAKYYPSIPNAKNIKILDLLTMTSGLFETKSKGFEQAMQEINYQIKETRYTGKKTWNYDGINYKILAGICAKITHESYSEGFEQTFNQDLNLDVDQMPNFNQATTSIGMSTKPKLYHAEAATGSVFASTTEMYQYFYDLTHYQVVDQKTFKNLMAKRSEKRPYVAGLYVNPKYYRAHGVLSSYEPTVIFNRDMSMTVILLSNQKGKTTTRVLGNSIYSLINGSPYLGGNTY